MIWDALFSGHPLGIFAGLLQLGAIVFVIVVGIIFHRAEKELEERRRKEVLENLPDVSDPWPKG